MPCEIGSKYYYYDRGCLFILQNEVKDYALLLGGVGIGLACVQVNVNGW
jgi:hypothetical protein